MEIIGIILGIVALLVGVYHVREIKLVLRDSKAELKNLETIQGSISTELKNLETIQGSISTRYLAEFPFFITDIVKLIKEARAEVDIFCDIPAYGQFTARSDWIQYSQAIESLDENVKITLTCLNPERRVSFYQEQFLQDTSWEEWKDLPVNKERLKHLLLAKKVSLEEISSLKEERFVGFLEDTNSLMIKTALVRADVREIEFFMPTYFWLVDGTDAIFSIPSFSGGHSEYGFITTDQKLIDALREMRQRIARRPTVPATLAKSGQNGGIDIATKSAS